MSVSFSVPFETTGRFFHVTWNDDGDRTEVAGPFASYAEACEALTPGEIPVTVRPEAVRPDAPVVNLANSNAAVVLAAMGLPWRDELIGKADALDFRRRVMTAIAAEADASNGDTYTLRRLVGLVELADYAEQNGLPVSWA
jgi:hypothetical protein